MKTVKVSFFKPSGKYYTSEDGLVSEELLGGSNKYWEALEGLHRIKEMFMLVQDSDDNKEPYIVPHLFKPLKED